jgi:hypothetical protein
MNTPAFLQQAPFGYLVPPFPLLRTALGYRGAALEERIGKSRLLALTISQGSIQPSVITCANGDFSATALPAVPCTDWRIPAAALQSLKTQSRASYLAVSYARPPESTFFDLISGIQRLPAEINFQIALAHAPEKIAIKLKSSCHYRGFQHPDAPLAMVAMVDLEWEAAAQRSATTAGMVLVRTELAILKLANVGLADARVRAGASLLILDHNQALWVTSSQTGVWTTPRFREFKATDSAKAMAAFTGFVEQVVKVSAVEPHQKRIVLLDTYSTPGITPTTALSGFEIEHYAAAPADATNLNNLALAAA